MNEFSIAGCTVCVKKSFKAVSERSAVFVKLVEAGGGEEKRLKNTESNAHLVYRRKQEFFVLQHQ